MAFKGKARAGLLLLLTAGPFLVFLFLYLFGKNHFELDRYPATLKDFLPVDRTVSGTFLLMDTASYDNPPGALKSQMKRLDAFWEDIGRKPETMLLNGTSADPSAGSQSWYSGIEPVQLTTVKGNSKKILPKPPRAFLFDEEKTLRGVYGLCNNKSVDTLMLEYRILTSE
jgi:hypothetical protein